MGSVGRKFLEGVDAEMERMFGPEALARWNAVSAPLGPASIGPLSAAAALTNSLAEADETPAEVLGGQAWPVSERDGS